MQAVVYRLQVGQVYFVLAVVPVVCGLYFDAAAGFGYFQDLAPFTDKCESGVLGKFFEIVLLKIDQGRGEISSR